MVKALRGLWQKSYIMSPFLSALVVGGLSRLFNKSEKILLIAWCSGLVVT